MKDWFTGLQPRERLLLIGGSAVLVLLLFYTMMWEPLSGSVRRLRANIAQQESLLSWIQDAAQDVKALRGTSRRPAKLKPGQSLFSLIDSTAKSSRLGDALKRVKPDGENKVSVWLEEAAFDDVMRWLENLQRSYGIEIKSITIDRKDIVGKVDAKAVLAGNS